MAVLVANPGSSSLKLSIVDDDDAVQERDDGPSQDASPSARLAGLIERHPVVRAVGVRVVHGGRRFTEATVVDTDVAAALAALDDLAPLHNPPARSLIDGLRREHPELTVVACFDTAFHTTLPAAAHTYALPRAWREDLGVRRYGFHGLSHRWASRRAAALVGRPVEELRTVTCHLGAGASLCAVSGGRSVDTTMGFTPLEGLVMATRSGSVDPGALLWLQSTAGLSVDEVAHGLEHEAGLLGLSGTSGDLREVLAARDDGDDRARLAVDVLVHRLRAGVAAMVAALDGVDVLVFTGGIGEHLPAIREGAAAGLAHLGVAVDPSANQAAVGVEGDISAAGATVRTLVVTAREDLEIARQVRATLPDQG